MIPVDHNREYHRSIHIIINSLAFLTLYIICWLIYKDFGVSTDEPLHLTRVPLYFSQWAQIFDYGYVVSRVIGDMRYGVLFNLLAHPFIVTFSKNTRFLLEVYEIKHIVTFHVYLLTYLAIAYALFKACGYKYALALTVLILGLFPNLFGQGFFNPKDIPFAAFFTFASVLIAYRTSVISTKLQRNLEFNILVEALLISFLIGIASGVRIAGLIIVPAWLCLILKDKNFYKNINNLITTTALLLLAALFSAIILLMIYPSAISSPLKWMFGTIVYFNNGTGLGEPINFIKLIEVFWIKIPIMWLVTSIVGVVLFLIRWKQSDIFMRNIGGILLLQIIAIPLLMITLETRTYHQERHFLLSFPPLVFFAAYGIISIYQLLQNKRGKYISVLIVTVFAINTAKEMINLHPYQYVYVNELARFNERIKKQTRDYWGIARKPILEWMNANIRKKYFVMTQAWYAHAPNSIALNLYSNRNFKYSSYKRGILVASLFPPIGCITLYEERRNLGHLPLYLGGAYDCIKQPSRYRIIEFRPRPTFRRRSGSFLQGLMLGNNKPIIEYDFFAPKIN